MLQYRRFVVLDRRRSRRIEADRPTTDDWSVRESMVFDFLLAAVLAGGLGPDRGPIRWRRVMGD